MAISGGLGPALQGGPDHAGNQEANAHEERSPVRGNREGMPDHDEEPDQGDDESGQHQAIRLHRASVVAKIPTLPPAKSSQEDERVREMLRAMAAEESPVSNKSRSSPGRPCRAGQTSTVQGRQSQGQRYGQTLGFREGSQVLP